MITREQVADLQPGDVVEVRDIRWPEGTVLRGAVWIDSVAGPRKAVGWFYPSVDAGEFHTLTVVSRAPRPLYVNHPRTEPVPGDVAADWESEDDGCRILLRTAGQRFPAKWVDQNGMERTYRQPARLRLLVDGETGQVVP